MVECRKSVCDPTWCAASVPHLHLGVTNSFAVFAKDLGTKIHLNLSFFLVIAGFCNAGSNDL